LYAFQNPTVFVDPDGREALRPIEQFSDGVGEKGEASFNQFGPRSKETVSLPSDELTPEMKQAELEREFQLREQHAAHCRNNNGCRPSQSSRVTTEADETPRSVSFEDRLRGEIRDSRRALESGAKAVEDGGVVAKEVAEAFLPASTGELIVGIGVVGTKVFRVFTKDGRTEEASQEDLDRISGSIGARADNEAGLGGFSSRRLSTVRPGEFRSKILEKSITDEPQRLERKLGLFLEEKRVLTGFDEKVLKLKVRGGLTQIDAQTEDFIIEATITDRRFGKKDQIEALNSLRVNPDRKPVLLFAPNAPGSFSQRRDIEAQGARLVTSFEELTKILNGTL